MKLSFDNLKFTEVRPNHFQAIHQFGQYELSVILEGRKTRYEVAIFKDGEFVQLPGIHPDYGRDDAGSDVIPYLLPEDVTGIMTKLEFLETFSKEVDIRKKDVIV